MSPGAIRVVCFEESNGTDSRANKNTSTLSSWWIRNIKACSTREKGRSDGIQVGSATQLVSLKMKRMLYLASEKWAFSWLTVLPLVEMNFTLNKQQFRDALKPRYDWPLKDSPTRCACEDLFIIDNAIMTCKVGGFIIQRHNELRDLEADLLNIVCNDVRVELPLQEVNGEVLNSGSNTAQDARWPYIWKLLWSVWPKLIEIQPGYEGRQTSKSMGCDVDASLPVAIRVHTSHSRDDRLILEIETTRQKFVSRAVGDDNYLIIIITW